MRRYPNQMLFDFDAPTIADHPHVARAPQPTGKMRECLKCSRCFMSEDAHHKICDPYKRFDAWRELSVFVHERDVAELIRHYSPLA